MVQYFRSFRRFFLVRLLGFFKLSAVAFTFQCCYGTPQDMEMDVRIDGYVTASDTGLPIEGISVKVDNKAGSVLTNNNGFYCIYTLPDPDYKLKFSDIDGNTNGLFWDKTTEVSYINSDSYLTVDIALNRRNN